MREVVKGYLARLEAEQSDTSAESAKRKLQGSRVSAAEADEFMWLRALRYCPQELIELINSKACRGEPISSYLRLCAKTNEDPGAIMFNDRLTDTQRRRLVRQLAATAFPFQCAHGRYICMLRVGLVIFLIISVFEGRQSFLLRISAL